MGQLTVRLGGRGKGWEWPNWAFGPNPTYRDKIGPAVASSFFLLFLAQPVAEVFSGPAPTALRAGVLAVCLVYAASYAVTAFRGHGSSHRTRAVMVAWLTVFPIVLALLLGPDALLFATYAVSAALMLLPRNIGGLIGLGFAAALLIGTSVVDGTAKWGAVLTLAAVTVMTFTVSGLVTTVKELRRTHGMAAKLAVAEERARLARDLHDVLGHSLTTITVKAGLARRLLESSPDRDRAVAEVRDVEDLARQALSDVRATVSGHRVSSLPAELVGARAALQAAGITADLPHATDNVTAGLQETFAYVLREGVTNVIRHSAATRCEVRLGERWLEVRDNGTAGQRIATASLVGERGHGLSGLADRMRSVGGDLEAGPGPGGGFLLRASVCTPAPDTTNVDLP